MKLIAKAGAIGAAVTGVLALSAAPAHAYDVRVAQHGRDYARVVEPYPGALYRLEVDDNECDNHRVWMEWVNYGSTVVHTLRDPDGCRGDKGIDTQERLVSSFRVCERTKGCSGWN
jgi:hypothetical protein